MINYSFCFINNCHEKTKTIVLIASGQQLGQQLRLIVVVRIYSQVVLAI